jgi:deoxyribodipyrimidine photolyase-related protein
MKTLRLILGDQLNTKHSWLRNTDDSVIYCLFEMRQETDYTRHHILKAATFFAAMRSFAKQLETDGHNVIYYRLDGNDNKQKLTENVRFLIDKHSIEKFEYQLPDEYRLDEELKAFCKGLHIESEAFDTEHFYTSRTELEDFFKGKKQLLMENFYRYMRKKHDILMEGKNPEGGKWNFDETNRNKWNPKTAIPQKPDFKHNVSEIISLLQKQGVTTMGRAGNGYINQPITRKEALELLKFFCEKLLLHFGDYQDAMHTEETTLFHSQLSFAINAKIISPRDVVTTVHNYYHKHKDTINISEAEGFIRQIIGWREYMRGIYWMHMPGYKKENYFGNKNKLPDFYWTGQTKMNCLKHSVSNSLDAAYAHHIQRLMVLGNFALLIQASPDEVDEWYLGVYIDAVEWVQLPNTRGMSQFADGGTVATKPYISSANYINSMSNYCGSCFYNAKTRTEEKSCPFNSLYWNFLYTKKKLLEQNPRMAFMYKQLDKIKPEEIELILKRADKIINAPDDF